MKSSWKATFRRLAAGCIISAGMAWSSAISYAVTLANDSASDPTYASGWAAGQNGGTGFTAWAFESGYFWPYSNGGTNTFFPYDESLHTIDNGLQAGSQFSNPFNNVGRSWTAATIHYADDQIGNPKLSLPRAGRGFPALQQGQTFSVTIDNPTERKYFKGYSISLNGNTNGQHGNICYGNRPCYYVPDPAHPGQYIAGAQPKPEIKIQVFNFSNCYSGMCSPSDPRAKWAISGDGGVTVQSTVTDLDSAAGGMRVDITRTTATDFSVTLTPLANPGAAFTTTGTFDNATFPIDWFQFESFNGIESDAGTPIAGDFNSNGKVDAADYVLWRNKNGTNNPLNNDGGLGTPINIAHYNLWKSGFGNSGGAPTTATDFYIRSMSISAPGSGLGSGTVPEPSSFVYLVSAAASSISLLNRRRPVIMR
jgi:hypothetical protein